ncbi:hypothetical protein ACCO45_010513 [Purpureocillium lilacinum]|uniref:Uncharacterized protein n=1 Tax=Purpureocillium lilacinum TaxID=33203 RepID=A0ACC4DI26_PURLI
MFFGPAGKEDLNWDYCYGVSGRRIWEAPAVPFGTLCSIVQFGLNFLRLRPQLCTRSGFSAARVQLNDMDLPWEGQLDQDLGAAFLSKLERHDSVMSSEGAATCVYVFA